MRLIRAFINWLKGILGGASERMAENKHVMAATYDTAIDKQGQRFQTVRNAVAELISIEQTRVREIQGLSEDIERISRIRTAAQAAMQNRIDTLKKQGQSKDQILADSEFIKHKTAYEDASSTFEEKSERVREKEAELAERRQSIATFKAELQDMQRKANKLKEEKNEALADVAIAQQADAITSVLAGLSNDSTDQDLAAARAARQRATSRAKVTAELAGNDAKLAENEYLAMANKLDANKELDSLLNWGDEETSKQEELDDAKLPG